MVSCLSTLCLFAALGQAPSTSADAALLKSVPADIEVVVRVRAIDSVRGDLTKMLQAMSPTLSAMAVPTIENALNSFTQQHGNVATGSSMLAFFHLPKQGDQGPPPLVLLVKSTDYAAVTKSVMGPNNKATPKKQAGGYDQLGEVQGQTVYAYKGNGFVAIGESQDLMKAVVKPTKTLDAALTPELRDNLMKGDVGIYVNLASVQSQYGDQLDMVKQQALAGAEQGQTVESAKETTKNAVNTIFETLKEAQALALNFDFAPEGLTLSGQATTKANSSRVKALATAKSGTGEMLTKLPANSAFFVYYNVDPASFEKMQKIGLSFMAGGDEPTPEMTKAMAMFTKAKPTEAIMAVSAGKGGMQTIQSTTFADPATAMKAMDAVMAAQKSAKPGPKNVVKSVKIATKPEVYQGISFSSSQITFDKEKLAALQPNGQKNPIASMIGDSQTTWYGVSGKSVIAVGAQNWNDAKAQIDAVTTGKGSLGQSASYKAIRAKMPKQISGAFLLNAQSIVKLVAAAAPGGAAPAAANDQPQSPALLGGSVTRDPKGLNFQLIVPSAVGPVIENGVGPLMQGGGRPGAGGAAIKNQ